MARKTASAPKNESASSGVVSVLLSLRFGFLAAISLLAVFLAVQSITYRVQHDAPMVLYPAFLFFEGYGVPYRDIFDVNMPGSFFLYGLIGKLVGFSDVALRVFDVLLLALLSLLGYRLLAPISKRTAIFATAIFALLYLSQSWWLALQREFFILLFTVGAACILLSQTQHPQLRHFFVGLLAAACAAIKPQALIAFLWLFIWDAKLRRSSSVTPAQKYAGWLLGFCLPLALMLLYMRTIGALEPWLDIVSNYLPLYAQISGDIRILEPSERPSIIATGLLIAGGYYAFYVIGLFNAVFATRRKDLAEEARERIVLVTGLTIMFWIYPAFSGQFWLYHWLPFFFFAAALVGVSLMDFPKGPKMEGVAVLSLSAAVLTASVLVLKPSFLAAFAGQPVPKQGRVDAIVTYLRPRLQPGDRIQPLDWTGGAVHAMLILRVPMATRYMQDFYFYHHVDRPYIQKLRTDFIEQLKAAPPRFIISITAADKPFIKGPGTSRSFPALETFLSENYATADAGRGYVIFERRH